MKHKKAWIFPLALLAGFALSPAQAAETGAAGLLNEAARDVPQLDLDEDDLEERWRDWVNAKPWSNGSYSGNVQQFPGRGIIVSSGVAYVKTRKGQPGWNESRVIAYDQAEMEARARLVALMENTLTNGRKLDVMENPEFRDGVVQDMREISGIRQTLERWGRKAVRLTDAVWDKLIRLADEDYDPAELNALPPERQKVILEELYEKAIRQVMVRSLDGVATAFTAEGAQGEQYRVLVGIIWSPRLEQVSRSIRNRAEPMPAGTPGMDVDAWVNNMGARLLGMWGTRVVMNDRGHFSVVAFAQAEPAPTALTRQHSAIHRAREVAENRARAMIADFVTEKLVVKDSQQTSQIFQELEDKSAATEIVRRTRKVVEGRRKTLRLSGLRTLKRWSMTHPVTGQKVAGAVVAWSPSSQEMARRMSETMNRPMARPDRGEKPGQSVRPSTRIIQSVDIDTSAY